MGLRGGLVICSVYLETKVGLGAESKNWQSLLRIGETLNHFGRPFIVAGDFNNSVGMLDATGWPSSIQGRILAVGAGQAGTCRSAQGRWSNIDYFICSRHLAEAVVHLHTVSEEAPKPHLPVRLKLDKRPRQYRELILKRIRQFPCFVPICPPLHPPEWDSTGVVGGKVGGDRLRI